MTEYKLKHFKPGDRIRVKIGGAKRWATVVHKGTKGDAATTLYLDTPYRGVIGESWNINEDKFRLLRYEKMIEKLGLNTTSNKFWEAYPNETIVIDVGTRASKIPKISDLKEGDYIKINHHGHVSWATVVEGAEDAADVYLDTQMGAPHKSWLGDSQHLKLAQKFGLNSDAPNFRRIRDDDTKVLEVGIPKKPVSLPEKVYQLGERVKIKVLDDGRRITDATVIDDGQNSTRKVPLFYLDKSYGWSPKKAKDELAQEACKNFGFNDKESKAWYGFEGDFRFIRTLDEEIIKPKGEKEMRRKKIKYKVGERIKVQITNDDDKKHLTWATVISSKGLDDDPYMPLLYLDNETDDSWTWDEDWQRKAAVKQKADPDEPKFWWLCAIDTEVVQRGEGDNVMEEDNKDHKFTEMVKKDMVDAGYRVASNQMVKGIKAGVLKLFKDKGADDGKIAVLKEVLDSDVGSMAISLLLGYGLGYVPKIGDDPRVKKLSKEFRVEGFTFGGNLAADTIMQYLAPAVMEAVNALPPVSEVVETVAEKTGLKKKTKKRVGTSVRVKEEEQEHEEEETNGKRAHA